MTLSVLSTEQDLQTLLLMLNFIIWVLIVHSFTVSGHLVTGQLIAGQLNKDN